jgi:hypothetical protein
VPDPSDTVAHYPVTTDHHVSPPTQNSEEAENLEAGATIDEIMDWFHLTREQIVAVLEFAARSLDPPQSRLQSGASTADAGSL